MLRWLGRIVVVLLVVAVLAAAGGWFALRTSLPQLDGEVRLDGLAAPVEIVRDRHGIPHIFAQSAEDVAYGLGYAHAQDRLWQMEISRRLGAGRLSELVGEDGLKIDRFLRTLGLYRQAEKSFDLLNEETQAALEAYARGVNAYLSNHTGLLPPEFLILRHRPEAWKPADSLVWLRMMSLDLAANWGNELLRLRLSQVLPPQRIRELFQPYGMHEIRGLPDWSISAGTVDHAGLDRLWRSAPIPPPGLGSNNWVVSGARTASGKPLLANDPHLGLQAPSLWYFAHLSWPGNDVIGASLPGLPSIILGRNRQIAWGFTNTGPDVQDLYLERIDPADPGRYLTPDGPRPFNTREEVIAVKGAEPVRLTVRETRHGPVLSDAYAPAQAVLEEGFVLALAWTSLRADDLTAQAGLKLNKARDWSSFVNALKDFHSPQQNIVYADRAGHIGYLAPARVPLRKAGNAVRGYTPQPGWDATYDWAGTIPFEKLPRAFDPPGGVIATANHRIVGDDYPYFITSEWAPDFRARRILTLLNSRAHHSLQSFKQIQLDVRSEMAAELLPRFLEAGARPQGGIDPAAFFGDWDYRHGTDSAEALLYSAWLRELTRLIYADELGELFDDAWQTRPRFMRFVLLGEGAHWCDDVNSDASESCDQMIDRAFERAVAWVMERHGDDPRGWRWGDAHPARGKHRPFGDVPVLRRLFDITVPSPGGNYTVNVGRFRVNKPDSPFENVHAASLRAIYDLDDLDRSIFIHSTGQSGNPLSPLFRNFAEPWVNGDYLPMTTRRGEIEAGAMGTLWLRPR